MSDFFPIAFFSATIWIIYYSPVVTMNNEFGSGLQHARERAGMTQEQLASAVGVSQQSVAKWESGKSFPRHKALLSLVEILELPTELIHIVGDAFRRSSNMPTLTLSDDSDDLEITDPLMDLKDVPDAFPAPSATPRPIEYAKACNQRIAAFLGPGGGRWISQDERIPGRWEHDYGTPELVVEFMHAANAGALAIALRHSVHRKLWRMLTARAYKKDNRSLLFVVTLPSDIESKNEVSNQRSMLPSNDVLLHRLTTEAALLDISVFLARTPSQAASIIKSFNSHENESWD